LNVMYRSSRNSITRSKNERRLFIGQELDECNDYGNLTFNIPFDRVSTTAHPTQDVVSHQSQLALVCPGETGADGDSA
jgi:hypothetical protein